jgi:hypothetical protein
MKQKSLPLKVGLIFIGMCFTPLGIFIGFKMATEEWGLVCVGVAIDMVITCCYDILYWKLMERISK